jgi:hypothetical protein
MEHYFTSLLESDLLFGPLPTVVAGAAWFVVNHWIVSLGAGIKGTDGPL